MIKYRFGRILINLHRISVAIGPSRSHLDFVLYFPKFNWGWYGGPAWYHRWRWRRFERRSGRGRRRRRRLLTTNSGAIGGKLGAGGVVMTNRQTVPARSVICNGALSTTTPIRRCRSRSRPMTDAAQRYKIIILVTCASMLLVATAIMTWATQNAGVPFLVVSAIYFGRIYEVER